MANNEEEGSHCISMDDILHLDSIPGLANILADDSIDPTSLDEHSILEQAQPQHYTHQDAIDHLGRGSKFSQFFQQDCRQMLGQQVSSQFEHNSAMSSGQQAHQNYKGINYLLTQREKVESSRLMCEKNNP